MRAKCGCAMGPLPYPATHKTQISIRTERLMRIRQVRVDEGNYECGAISRGVGWISGRCLLSHGSRCRDSADLLFQLLVIRYPLRSNPADLVADSGAR